MWQAGVVARRSSWIRDGVGFLCEERHGSGSRRERKDLGRGTRDAEVVWASKHGDRSRLELWFHAAYSHGIGGARSWIWAAESLSITRIGPPQRGQIQKLRARTGLGASEGTGVGWFAEPSK